ncbi:uncharacterized protein LOC107676182 [Sinocyclocheilus anshuiensis]|uniref:uncharacterized protein LOC107676182 n=1 Tax=Sinocyclocheilus anshuiensis TaxID=1608454 RepID=UPI0007BA65EB|nr:PREDICTED: uncharacterized protein LOC107676182 [Sinocyclocheilus anshuiensis]
MTRGTCFKSRIVASFAAMDVNIALGMLAALVILTSQPYNTEGGNVICHKDLHKLQKRSGEDVVLLEGYEVTPKDEERDGDCVEYEAARPFPTSAAQTTTIHKVPNTVKPVPTPKKTSKNQCWVYYGKPVKLYLHMRKLPTLPNSQGNVVVSGSYTGGINGFVNSQPRVVCGKVQITMRRFSKGLQDHSNGNQGKRNNKGSGVVRPIVGRPAMAIQVSKSGSSSFYNFLRSYQGVLAAQRTKGSSVSSRCV